MNTYERIKTLRIQSRLSQEELARLTGYTDRSSIAKIEAGKVDLTESKITAFANVFGVSPSYIMGLSEDGAPAPQMLLSSSEEELVGCYRSMNPEGQTAALAAVRGLASSGLYKKRDDPADLLDLG